MKKRFFPILFLFLMVFSTTAYAASTRAATVTPNISFHGTTANCSVFIVADKPTDDIDAVIKLWQGGQCTATIYWVDSRMIGWGITSKTKGPMVFTGSVTTNRGQLFPLGDIEFDGDCGGTIDNVTTRKGQNKATLSGIMIDANGLSITAPEVSASYYK